MIFDNFPTVRWSCLTPMPHEGQNYTDCNKNKFLSTPVCQYIDHTYTVKDIILYGAHIMGGVHSGKPKTDKEKTYLDIQMRLPLLGNTLYSISSYSIMEVIIPALEPLELAIKSHTPTGGF